MEKLTTEQIAKRAWMAGFMDGEGCFTITRQIRKGRPSPAYRTFIRVSNTRKASIDVFYNEYGGSIQAGHRKITTDERYAEAWEWCCPCGVAKKFINDLLPYLVIKQEQAEILLKFIETKNFFKRDNRGKRPFGRQGGSAPLTQEEIDHRESLRQKILILNMRGSRGQRIREQARKQSSIKT